MAFTLDDLNAETTAGTDDLFHYRNTSGLDKKIKYSDLSTQVLSYVDHIKKAEHTETGTAGWRTLLRTQKNFQGLVKISAYAGDRRQFLTLDIYGDEDTGEWDVGFVSQSQKGASTTPGIYRLRWGDAGNGNGFCLQAYVDKGSDPSVLIKVVTFAALPVDSSLTAGFALGPFTNTQSDLDSNVVSTFYGDYYSFMFNSLVAINHRRYQDLEDIVVDGTTVTEVKPGAYKSIHFTGNGTVNEGKYIIFGDFTIDVGAVASVALCPTIFYPFIPSFIGTYKAARFAAFDTQGYVPNPRVGGGKGSLDTGGGTSGGSGPCGGADGKNTSTSAIGGGYVFLNVLGNVNNSGTLQSNGENGKSNLDNRGDGGAAGGYIGIRVFRVGNTWGTIKANGGSGYNGSVGNGGRGGGGVIEIYAPETISGTLIQAIRGTFGGTSGGSDGNTWLVNVLASGHSKYWDEGGSDVATANEYIYAGQAIKLQGGWLP